MRVPVATGSQDQSGRAAVYARYSTENQREASTEDQFRACEKVATSQGLEVVARFEDKGISGGTAQRPGYQALLAGARRLEFCVIVVEDVSRLWRNRATYGQDSAELEDVGCNVVTCVGDDTRRDGFSLVLGIKQAIAESQRREISYRTKRGLEGLAISGKSTGATAYGYNGVSVNESEANTIRQIFLLAVQGVSPAQIAEQLDAPAPRGGTWHRNSVRNILKNPRYTGRVVFGATEGVGGARDSRLKRRIPRLEGPLVTRRDETLRIVSDELFYRVNLR